MKVGQGQHEAAARLTFEVALRSIDHQLSFLVAARALEVEWEGLRQGRHRALAVEDLFACSRHSGKDHIRHHPQLVVEVALEEVREECPSKACRLVVAEGLLWAPRHEVEEEERSLEYHLQSCCRQDSALEHEP